MDRQICSSFNILFIQKFKIIGDSVKNLSPLFLFGK